MSSHDKRWMIERYPNFMVGKVTQYSYGCPDLELMGYASISSLLLDIKTKVEEIEKRDAF